MNIAEGNENNKNANKPPNHELHTSVPIAITSYVDVGPKYYIKIINITW